MESLTARLRNVAGRKIIVGILIASFAFPGCSDQGKAPVAQEKTAAAQEKTVIAAVKETSPVSGPAIVLDAAAPTSPAPLKFSSGVVLEVPYGNGVGQAGYANGIDHTPFPESVQAFKARGTELLLADTFNGRIQIWETGTGKCKTSIVPVADAEGSFICGIDWLDDGFILSDVLNSAILAVGVTGEVSDIARSGFAIDHITTVIATFGGLVFLGDKGPAIDTIRVVSRNSGLVASIPVPGLTEAGFAVDSNGRVLAATVRAGAENPVLDIFGATSEASESIAFAPIGSLEVRDSTFPPGRFNVAGIDGSGRIYLYWAGLAEYFGPSAGQFPDDIKALPSTQMIARFNVVDPGGRVVADFFSPVSTAPETASVTPEGELFVMAYDATSAPEGTIRFLKFSCR